MASEIDRLQIKNSLVNFLPAEFEDVVFEYNPPLQYLPTATQLDRAIAIVRYAESRGELAKLQQIIDKQLSSQPAPVSTEPVQTEEKIEEQKLPQQTKILFLAAAPNDRVHLRTDRELRDIEEALRRAGLREKFEFTVRHAMGVIELRRAVLEEKPDILHFAGHGDVAGIALEDEQGKSRLVSAAALADLFRLFADKLCCVVLNTCYSKAQAEAISAHIAYVAGMKSEISDQAAHDFAVAFYDALGNGKEIKFAFDYARNAVHLEGHEAEYLAPVLLHKPITKQNQEKSELEIPKKKNHD